MRAALWVVTLGTLAVAYASATMGDVGLNPVYPVVFVLAVALQELSRGRVRDRLLKPLRPTERRQVVCTMLTGVPAGEPSLDSVSAELLKGRTRDWAWMVRSTFALTVLVAIGVFLAAGMRHEIWWLAVGLVDVPVLAGMYVAALVHPGEAARTRFAAG